MQDFRERAADIFQFFLGVDIRIPGSNVVHIRNQHQPTFFGFGVIQFVLAVLFLDDLTDLFGMQLIEKRKTVLQKQKNALMVGRSSDMFDEFCILVIGNCRRDLFDQLLRLLVKILLMIIYTEIIDSGKAFVI